ncbi:hypothetical protein OE88DRAFT_1132107 [Heliocybe sulcata]|uniref:Uncharacterized protein n=1 Tax=Heliocybe sulcata TaxID=5364 RepID=A0A5C3NAM3_9AGAM|nr:hypothetical protein OE88DRAFT_1132107 [Heliocybe sulcata]
MHHYFTPTHAISVCLCSMSYVPWIYRYSQLGLFLRTVLPGNSSLLHRPRWRTCSSSFTCIGILRVILLPLTESNQIVDVCIPLIIATCYWVYYYISPHVASFRSHVAEENLAEVSGADTPAPDCYSSAKLGPQRGVANHTAALTQILQPTGLLGCSQRGNNGLIVILYLLQTIMQDVLSGSWRTACHNTDILQ